jgi:transposase
MIDRTQKVQVWVIWLIAVLATMIVPVGLEGYPTGIIEVSQAVSGAAGVVIAEETGRELFPWLPAYRWRKRAWQSYCRWRQACWQARYRYLVALALARMAQSGVLSLAWVLDLLTRRQLRRYLGAIPVLYSVLEELQVAEVIDHYAPTESDLRHGTVGLVLILNRLHAPRPMWRVADWLGQTVLVKLVGVEAERFNKDRLARSLDALAPHTEEIWQAVVSRAIERYQIDLSVIYYDLTAFILHGEYAGSDLVEFGFAHNTPMDKRKVKEGLNAAADGRIPLVYQVEPGGQADKATVEENMKRLAALLKRHDHPLHELLVVGDRAMIDDRLALLYDQKGMRYLAGLEARKKGHRQLLELTSEADLRRHPLTAQRGRYGYGSRAVLIPFDHEGQRAVHRGLVILSGPMGFALRRSRAKQFRALWQALAAVQRKAEAGQARYRSPQQLQARAETQLRQSKVGQFVSVKAEQQDRRLILTWQVDVPKLQQVQDQDGRYLLVTNDPALSYSRMFELYRAKDGVEKDFRISKSQLKVSPLYLHKDERIQAMLLLNMLALLAYTLVERQAHHSGLALSTRRLIERLDSLTVIETQAVDGSFFYRLTPLTPEQAELVTALRRLFPAEVVPARLPEPAPTAPEAQLPTGKLLLFEASGST